MGGSQQPQAMKGRGKHHTLKPVSSLLAHVRGKTESSNSTAECIINVKTAQEGKLYNCLGTARPSRAQLRGEMAGLQQACSLSCKTHSHHSVFKPTSPVVQHGKRHVLGTRHSAPYQSITRAVALATHHVRGRSMNELNV